MATNASLIAAILLIFCAYVGEQLNTQDHVIGTVLSIHDNLTLR